MPFSSPTYFSIKARIPGWNAEVGGYISKDDHGYVTYETDGVFIALYCTKDMTLWVKAHSDDSIDDAKELLKDLGIPSE